jgi:integration host factor subunit beta
VNRSNLVDILASKFPLLSPADTEVAVTAILEAMSAAMARGHRIEIRGFGSFAVSDHAPRIGRNPRTGASVAIAAKRALRFKPGKALRDTVELCTAT